LESQIFGTPVTERLLEISTEIAAKILDQRSWESLDLLKDIFQILASFTISEFGGWECGKKEWNQLLMAEEKEAKEGEGSIEISGVKENEK